MSELPSLDDLVTEVSAINDRGDAVGVAGVTTLEDRAVFWDGASGEITELRDFPGGSTLSAAEGHQPETADCRLGGQQFQVARGPVGARTG
jgi:hypothetical protein